MREPDRTPTQELRRAVERLPRQTRLAMLEGIERNEIIAGAYSHGGGVCPMLAAHRLGGRTPALAFARAWDRFVFRSTRGRSGRRARRATERELLTLRAHLQASLLEPAAASASEERPGELAQAVADHRRLVARRREGERQRAGGLARERPSRAGGEADRSRVGEVDRSRAGDADRSGELRRAPGWAWSPAVRRYDEWRAMLRRHGEGAGTEHREPAVGSSRR